MPKKKTANTLLKENEQTLSRTRQAKPETELKRLMEKKFKAWSELFGHSSVLTHDEGMLAAFMAGARMGHNGAFKTE